jgi:hypothetical protein
MRRLLLTAWTLTAMTNKMLKKKIKEDGGASPAGNVFHICKSVELRYLEQRRQTKYWQTQLR